MKIHNIVWQFLLVCSLLVLSSALTTEEDRWEEADVQPMDEPMGYAESNTALIEARESAQPGVFGFFSPSPASPSNHFVNIDEAMMRQNFKDLEAGSEHEVRQEHVKNYGEPCWTACKGQQGKCPNHCGKGACCKIGLEYKDDDCDGTNGKENPGVKWEMLAGAEKGFVCTIPADPKKSLPASKDSCDKTFNGDGADAACVFPFPQGGQLYDECVTIRTSGIRPGKAWCYTELAPPTEGGLFKRKSASKKGECTRGCVKDKMIPDEHFFKQLWSDYNHGEYFTGDLLRTKGMILGANELAIPEVKTKIIRDARARGGPDGAPTIKTTIQLSLVLQFKKVTLKNVNLDKLPTPGSFRYNPPNLTHILTR